MFTDQWPDLWSHTTWTPQVGMERLSHQLGTRAEDNIESRCMRHQSFCWMLGALWSLPTQAGFKSATWRGGQYALLSKKHFCSFQQLWKQPGKAISVHQMERDKNQACKRVLGACGKERESYEKMTRHSVSFNMLPKSRDWFFSKLP